VVFVPRYRAFMAVEPVSNMNNGLNHLSDARDHGIKIIAPGETLEGRILMVLEPLA
jgi:aldose 1-epimerase